MRLGLVSPRQVASLTYLIVWMVTRPLRDINRNDQVTFRTPRNLN